MKVNEQKDKNKLYALRAPEVECLAKGKARTPYEFGVKVSITTTHKEGFVVGARSMPANPYDGHTLAKALEQAAILSDVKPEVAIVDRGYKGVAVVGVKIYHPGLRRGITRGLRAMIQRRSAIESAMGHMKAGGKLDRNGLKSALGDANHAVLCSAGHNLKMRYPIKDHGARAWPILDSLHGDLFGLPAYTWSGTLNISSCLPLGRVQTRPDGRRNFRGSSHWRLAIPPLLPAIRRLIDPRQQQHASCVKG